MPTPTPHLRSLLGVAFALVLVACPKDEPTPADGGTEPSTSEATGHTAEQVSSVDAFLAAMDASENDVREGGLFFSTYEGCCDEGAQCLGNNPATPYGTYMLPTLPDEAPAQDVLAPWGELPAGFTRAVRLRADEALVYVGNAPPEAAYFSLRSYQLTATDEEGTLRAPIGSLGEPVNHLSVAAERGVPASEVWGQPLAVITTADRAVEDRLRRELEAAGFDPAHIHADRMAYDVLHMGLDASADTYGVIWRVAVPADEAASKAFRDAPDGRVFRITPRTPQPLVAPHPRPDFQRLGADTDESAWTEALDGLEAALSAAYADFPSVTQTSASVYQTTLACLSTQCAGDIRDRMVRVSPDFTVDGDEFVIAFGVNHQRTGKACYSNAAIVEPVHGIGIAGFSSDAMVGSARTLVPDEPLVDDLYVWMVRRDCSGQVLPCAEIPVGCPGVDPGGEMRVTFRAYLDPTSGVAPAPWEMRPDRVIKFWPQSTQ